VAAQLHPFEYAAVNDLLRRATDLNEPVWLMILDQIQDVQNLGSLIRTAEAVGVHGLILPARRASAVTPAVWRTSAGAVAHLPVARVTNLARTMSWLRRLGVWLVGLDTGADLDYCATELHGPLAIVVGGEHAGLRRLVREQCDLVVSIPMRGMVESLNAAVAGSVLLYEALRQRRQADPTGGHGLRKPAGRLIMV
jgi:23S rRNA (guanosine2251-2'-O)-methyltransferase